MRDPNGMPIGIDTTSVLRQLWAGAGDLPIASWTTSGGGLLNVEVDGIRLGTWNGAFSSVVSDPQGTLMRKGGAWQPRPDTFGSGVSGNTGDVAWAGMEVLASTPYQLAQNRLYDGETGRFSSADPIGLAGGAHRFAYVGNNPATFVDPTGLFAQSGTSTFRAPEEIPYSEDQGRRYTFEAVSGVPTAAIGGSVGCGGTKACGTASDANEDRDKALAELDPEHDTRLPEAGGENTTYSRSSNPDGDLMEDPDQGGPPTAGPDGGSTSGDGEGDGYVDRPAYMRSSRGDESAGHPTLATLEEAAARGDPNAIRAVEDRHQSDVRENRLVNRAIMAGGDQSWNGGGHQTTHGGLAPVAFKPWFDHGMTTWFNSCKSAACRSVVGTIIAKTTFLPKSSDELVLAGVGAAVGAGAEVGAAARGGGRLLWTSWEGYPKVVRGGRQYAQIGNRLYTRHAVDRMLPAGLGAPGGATGAGRSIAPAFVEDVIANGTQTTREVGGVTRTIYTSGDVTVVTEESGQIVITVITGVE